MREYIKFYLWGRDDTTGVDADFDIEELAERVMKGGDLRETLVKAVTDASKVHEHARAKREWIEEHQTDIQSAGGDADKAYKEYVRGLVDETVCQLEPDVLEAMRDELGDYGFDDEDDDEESDEDDDDNDEDEED
jgi:hypothetical protein